MGLEVFEIAFLAANIIMGKKTVGDEKVVHLTDFLVD